MCCETNHSSNQSVPKVLIALCPFAGTAAEDGSCCCCCSACQANGVGRGVAAAAGASGSRGSSTEVRLNALLLIASLLTQALLAGAKQPLEKNLMADRTMHQPAAPLLFSIKNKNAAK